MKKKVGGTPTSEKRLESFDKKYPSKKPVLASMDYNSEDWYIFGRENDNNAALYGGVVIITKGKLIQNVLEVSPTVTLHRAYVIYVGRHWNVKINFNFSEDYIRPH